MQVNKHHSQQHNRAGQNTQLHYLLNILNMLKLNFPKDNKEQEAKLQNISDGIAGVFQLQYFIPLASHVHTPSL